MTTTTTTGLSVATQPLMNTNICRIPRRAAKMLEYPYHYCHVTTDMVQWILSHDNERELNDGRRTSSASQRAWLESLQGQETPEEFLLCFEVEARAGLSDVRNEVVTTDQRRCAQENRTCLRAVDIFSAATQRTVITIGTRLTERWFSSLLHAYYTVIWQHLATLRRQYKGYEVAWEGIS